MISNVKPSILDWSEPDTELTKEKQKSEIQKRQKEALIESARIEGHAGIPGWMLS